MAISLKDKVVLITGASSGFGADAAHLFAKEGASVVLAARRIDRLQELAIKIQEEGGEAMAIPVDVSERIEIEEMVQTIFEIYGHVDILFNNAGFGRLDYLENLHSGRDIETQLNVNLLGTILMTRVVLPYMIERKQGHIINMSSVSGYFAAPTYSIYAATKFGMRGFTEAVRREVAPFGIKVSGIYPGPAQTEFGLHTRTGEGKKGFPLPGWATMSSEFVANKVVQVAKNPRRSLVLPWWFNVPLWANDRLPGLVDWIILNAFTRKNHQEPVPPGRPASDEAPTLPPDAVV